MIRATVYYSGRVQGVGFRYTATHIAERFAVAGYVQNLPDGRVRLVAEGDAAEIKSFLEAVDDRLSRNIHSRTAETAEATCEFGAPDGSHTFTVRY